MEAAGDQRENEKEKKKIRLFRAVYCGALTPDELQS